MIVAIDGPAGTGKSTVARLLAERLGFRYLDTGAMYRALTWLALQRGIDLEDAAALAALARDNDAEIEGERIKIAGTDVTEAIRTAEIDRVVSSVARHQPVREVLRERQRSLAERGDAIMEGRDIGAVVVPHADVKIYLVADAGVRASRREAERPGIGADALATDLRLRDERDANQLQAAPDAETIDTTSLTVDKVVERIETAVAAAHARA
jgi:cytidylate kinase